MGNIDDKLYDFYLALPLANVTNFHENPLYKNNWCVICGWSFSPPSPHRHFMYSEFMDNLHNNKEFLDLYEEHKDKTSEELSELFKNEHPNTHKSLDEFTKFFSSVK